MKKITTTILLAFIVSAGMAQIKARYFKFTADFTLTNLCKSSAMGTFEFKGQSANYDAVKYQIKKFVSPNKLKSFEVTSLKEITKEEMIWKSEKFKCPDPLVFNIDTSMWATKGINTLGNAKYFSNFKPANYWMFIWNDGQKTFTKMQPLYKDSVSFLVNPIDSIRLFVKKSQLRWVNDSTVIIRKP